MNETWQKSLDRFKNIDKRTIHGYHFELRCLNLSVDDIRLSIQSGNEAKEIREKQTADEDDNAAFVYAVEILDSIIHRMVLENTKSSRNRIERSYKCKALIVSLAIKRGLNAELSKNTDYITIDCY